MNHQAELMGKNKRPDLMDEDTTYHTIKAPIADYTRYCSNNTHEAKSGTMVLVRDGFETPSFVCYIFEDAYRHVVATSSSSRSSSSSSSSSSSPLLPHPSFLGATTSGHTDEGRIIFLQFSSFLLVATYWPNLGTRNQERRKVCTCSYMCVESAVSVYVCEHLPFGFLFYCSTLSLFVLKFYLFIYLFFIFNPSVSTVS